MVMVLVVTEVDEVEEWWSMASEENTHIKPVSMRIRYASTKRTSYSSIKGIILPK
jgi:hypothetical protein